MSTELYPLFEKMIDRVNKSVKGVSGLTVDANNDIYLFDIVNLLDNSNFAYPVNQRGKLEYCLPEIFNIEDGTSESPCIDRWTIRSSYNETSEENPSFYAENGYISTVLTGQSETSLRQYNAFKNLGPDTKLTFAVKERNGTIHIVSGRPIDNPSTDKIGIYGTANDRVSPTYGLVSGYVEIKTTGDYIWAALYEGEYDHNSLPEYRPKDYNKELLTCMQYYRRKSYGYIPCATLSTTEFVFTLNLGSIPMIANPVVTVKIPDYIESSVFCYKGSSVNHGISSSSTAEVLNYSADNTILSVKVTVDKAISGISKRTGYITGIEFIFE